MDRRLEIKISARRGGAVKVLWAQSAGKRQVPAIYDNRAVQSLSTTFSRVSSSSLVELGSWRVAVPGLPVGPRLSRRRPYVRSLSPPNINFVMQPVLLCNSRLRAFLNYLNLVYYTHTHTYKLAPGSLFSTRATYPSAGDEMCTLRAALSGGAQRHNKSKASL